MGGAPRAEYRASRSLYRCPYPPGEMFTLNMGGGEEGLAMGSAPPLDEVIQMQPEGLD